MNLSDWMNIRQFYDISYTLCISVRRKCKIDRATFFRDRYVVKYNICGYIAYVVKENVHGDNIDFKKRSNWFWRELSSSIVIWNLGRVSRDLACDSDASTSRVLRYLTLADQERKDSSKADLSKLYSRLATKEKCKHLEMAVEKDVYEFCAQT